MVINSLFVNTPKTYAFIIILVIFWVAQNNLCIFVRQKNFDMSKLSDYPVSKTSPYEYSLKDRLNKCTGNRVLSFGNARIELGRYQNNITARVALTQKVDHETFIKVFKDGLKYIADLSRTAQSIMWYIMDNLPRDKSYVIIDNASIMDYCHFKTRKSVRDGVMELLTKNIIAKSPLPKKYWVNPLVVFNGNRITFAKEYILEE